jgi:hypothetical protein
MIVAFTALIRVLPPITAVGAEGRPTTPPATLLSTNAAMLAANHGLEASADQTVPSMGTDRPRVLYTERTA